MTLHIYFGTESGNSELVAYDVADQYGLEPQDLTDVDPADIVAGDLYLIICSTHGEGELPQGAVPFFEALEDASPNLSGVRYAMFGLGDSTYPDYSKGSEHLDRLFATLGAERIGEYGRHDAAGREDPSNLAIAWAEGTLASVDTALVAA